MRKKSLFSKNLLLSKYEKTFAYLRSLTTKPCGTAILGSQKLETLDLTNEKFKKHYLLLYSFNKKVSEAKFSQSLIRITNRYVLIRS